MSSLTDLLGSAANITSIETLTLTKVLSAILVFLICLIVITIIMKAVDRIQKKSKLDKTINSFIRSAIKVGLWIIAVIIIAEKLGIPTTSLVTLIGIAGLALSLSIQSVLSNLFSGLTLLTTKPFISGDYIELGEVSGNVTEVGLFYTTVTSFDNTVVYIPNSQVADAKLINHTKQKLRRVDLIFGVSYDAPTEAVKSALLEAAKEDGRILGEPAPFAGLESYKDSSIEYVLRAWTTREDYWKVYYSLNERVRDILDKHGIEIPYNHMDVRIIGKEQ